MDARGSRGLLLPLTWKYINFDISMNGVLLNQATPSGARSGSASGAPAERQQRRAKNIEQIGTSCAKYNELCGSVWRGSPKCKESRKKLLKNHNCLMYNTLACGLKTMEAVSEDGSLYKFDTSSGEKRVLSSSKRFVAVYCGAYHTATVKEDGTLYTFGSGSYGRLGHGDTRPKLMPSRVGALQSVRVISVSCGDYHTAAVGEDGKLYTFGAGQFGRLGHGGDQDQFVPKRVEGMPDGVRVVAVSCGFGHTAAVSEEGTLYTFGIGFNGRLGHGDQEDQLVPKRVDALQDVRVVDVSCGSQHTAAASDNGMLYTFGYGSSGLGHGDSDRSLCRIVW